MKRLILCVVVVLLAAGGRTMGAVPYTITDLGTLGLDYSWAFDINEAGQVVGESRIASGQWRAFLYEDGNMTNLGTLGGADSYAYGINDAGQVVGNAYGYLRSTHIVG